MSAGGRLRRPARAAPRSTGRRVANVPPSDACDLPAADEQPVSLLEGDDVARLRRRRVLPRDRLAIAQAPRGRGAGVPARDGPIGAHAAIMASGDRRFRRCRSATLRRCDDSPAPASSSTARSTTRRRCEATCATSRRINRWLGGTRASSRALDRRSAGGTAPQTPARRRDRRRRHPGRAARRRRGDGTASCGSTAIDSRPRGDRRGRSRRSAPGRDGRPGAAASATAAR